LVRTFFKITGEDECFLQRNSFVVRHISITEMLKEGMIMDIKPEKYSGDAMYPTKDAIRNP